MKYTPTHSTRSGASASAYASRISREGTWKARRYSESQSAPAKQNMSPKKSANVEGRRAGIIVIHTTTKPAIFKPRMVHELQRMRLIFGFIGVTRGRHSHHLRH